MLPALLPVVSLLALAAPSAPPAAYQRGAAAITEAGLRSYLTFIASDALQGRDTPSPGLDAAAEFIAFNLRRAGLKPGGDEGTYFQKILLTRTRLDREKSLASVAGRALKYGDDFSAAVFAGPGSGAGTGEAKGGLVYVGHGWEWKAKGIDPYAGIDIRGKIVVINGSQPEAAWRTGRPGTDYFSPVQAATRGGATGVVVVNSGEDEGWRTRVAGMDRMMGGGFFSPTEPSAVAPSVPLITLGPTASRELLAGTPVAGDDRPGGAADYKGIALDGAKELAFTVARAVEKRWTQNVVGILEGADPKLKAEYVALGAHYDHVGTRNFPDGRDGIYNGADDDGSGTCGLLGLVGAATAGPRPKRSVIFVWHAGEEKGLWGSEYFTDHPTVPIGSIVTQLNIDMIGRSKKAGDTKRANAELSGPDEIYVIGSRMLSSELGKVSDSVNAGYLNLKLNFKYDDPQDPNRFYYRSDHYNYARKGIPIIFYFDGVHEDYHQPGDEVSKIDFVKMAKVTRTVYMTLMTLADRPERPKVDGKARE